MKEFNFKLNGRQINIAIKGRDKKVYITDNINYLYHFNCLYTRMNEKILDLFKMHDLIEIKTNEYTIEWFKQMIYERDCGDRHTTLDWVFYGRDTHDYYFVFSTDTELNRDCPNDIIINYNIETEKIRLFIINMAWQTKTLGK